MTVLHRRTVSSRIAWHPLWLRAADMRFEARQQTPDLAVDLRHFVGGPQHVLQTAFVQRLYLSEPQARPCFHQSHRPGVGDGARGIENEHAAIRRGGSRGSEHVKVRFWRQLADKHGKVSADAGQPIVTASSPKTYISKDILAKVGWILFCNHCKNKMSLSCCFPAAVPLLPTTSCHSRTSWHSV
jgi:hypothetical protein